MSIIRFIKALWNKPEVKVGQKWLTYATSSYAAEVLEIQNDWVLYRRVRYNPFAQFDDLGEQSMHISEFRLVYDYCVGVTI
ncbi:MAG TPA: hypothetical protein PK317_00945 [Coprothermobacter proteolyticus]|nr:hypothetical protein [Coprothermobacter proteolyticus]